MRTFEVTPGVAPSWPGITASGEVVARFLGRVRTTGDAAAAAEVMAPSIRCHQVNSEAPETLVRTPGEYAEHVQDMLAAFGRFRYTVTELLVEATASTCDGARTGLMSPRARPGPAPH